MKNIRVLVLVLLGVAALGFPTAAGDNEKVDLYALPEQENKIELPYVPEISCLGPLRGEIGNKPAENGLKIESNYGAGKESPIRIEESKNEKVPQLGSNLNKDAGKESPIQIEGPSGDKASKHDDDLWKKMIETLNNKIQSSLKKIKELHRSWEQKKEKVAEVSKDKGKAQEVGSAY